MLSIPSQEAGKELVSVSFSRRCNGGPDGAMLRGGRGRGAPLDGVQGAGGVGCGGHQPVEAEEDGCGEGPGERDRHTTSCGVFVMSPCALKKSR